MREALVFLAAAVVCVPVAARLGLGSVLGYLIAGAAIGPWGLGLAGDVTATQALAELGVVLMLFVIGIELDPRRLAAMRREVFGYGSVQMAACGATLAVFLLALGLPWQAALIGGLALALSSTAIAVQAMTERNELRTPTGNTSFGILLFQDMAAIPLIALVPLLGHVDRMDARPVWEKLALGVAAIAGVVVIGRYLTRPVLRVLAKVRLRELFTAFALSSCWASRSWSRSPGCRWGWAPSSPACCSRIRNSATRSRATSSRSRDCCSASSSSRSG